jgi:diadenosine tetraphosphate (Ap4A) HIT family hydrolase
VSLHPTLAADCHVLGCLASAHLLLHRNAALHWFILVPETAVIDLLDLPAQERDALMRDAASVARVLKDDLAYPRVNVGSLGLVVPQLHLHVVGRREGDPCWPAPVWGNLPAGAQYTVDDLQELRGKLALV